PHVDPARDGSAEWLDRGLAGQTVGILDPDAPSRHADDEVIQDVHRRRRGAGRLHAGEVQRDVARGLECGKHPLADEQLAGLLDPVLAEYALHAVHGGTAQADRDVPVAARVLRLTQPRVLHAVSADERDPAVDDAYLSMVALVLMTDLLQPAGVEASHAAAGRREPLLGRVAHALAAERVDEEAHLDACPRALGHDVAEPSRRLAVLPDVRLEMDRRLGAAHFLLDRVEEGAVLDQLDGIALDQRSLREADERRQERLELGVRMDDEMRL